MNIGLLNIMHNKVWDFRPDLAQTYADALKNAVELHLPNDIEKQHGYFLSKKGFQKDGKTVGANFEDKLYVGDIVHEFAGEDGTVKAANDVEIDGPGFVREVCEVNAVVLACHFVYVEQMHDDVIQYGAFAHSVDAAEYVHSGLQVPADAFVSVPKRVYLDALDVLSVHDGSEDSC